MAIRYEALPSIWPAWCAAAVESRELLEQLQFTRDETDYCWYSSTLSVSKATAGRGMLCFEGVGDFVSVFIDGRRVARTAGPLPENRALLPGSDTSHLGAYADALAGYAQSFELDLKPGEHRLEILCSAFGLAKIELMIGGANLADERKGLWGQATWQGRPIRHWRIQPGLLHEQLGPASDEGPRRPWRPAGAGTKRGPLWCRTRFPCPVAQEGLALDLAAMDKGMIVLNGRMVSRYWTVPADSKDPILVSWDMPLTEHADGRPTQRYYRLPAEWLRSENELLLFEEFGGRPADIRLAWR